MRLLATNIVVWANVKPRFKWAVSALPMGLMFAAFVPSIAMAVWLAGALHMGSGPVRGQSAGLLWLVLFLSTTLVLMLAGYALGWVLNVLIARAIFGWPAEKTRAVFLQSNIPTEWQEPDTSTLSSDAKSASAGKPASWAHTRVRGRWHFVLVRGVFGWGGAMFVGVALMPVLTHRREPSLFYFVSEFFVWSLAGALFGLATWSWSERLFKKQSTAVDSQ